MFSSDVLGRVINEQLPESNAAMSRDSYQALENYIDFDDNGDVKVVQS